MIEGDLITALPIDEETEEFICKEFSKALGDTVVLKKSIDESIIGGFVVNIDGRVYDGSVLASIDALKEFITDY